MQFGAVTTPPQFTAWAERLSSAIHSRNGVLTATALNPAKCGNWMTGPAASFICDLTPVQIEALTRQLPLGGAGAGVHKTVMAFIMVARELVAPTSQGCHEQDEEPSSQLQTNWPAIVRKGISLLTAWIESYISAEGRDVAWMVPTMSSICSFLVDAAYEADRSDNVEEVDDGGDDPEANLLQNDHQQKVLNTIRQHIGKFRGDNRRQGTYIVFMCESIRACINLRNMQMASAFLKTVESSPVVDVSNLPRGPTVLFRYLLGKLYMQQEQFLQAEQVLVWAFSNCRSKQLSRRRDIMKCLVAVRMRLGQIAPSPLLAKYNLNNYEELTRAVKRGSIMEFDTALRRHESDFVADGTLLCLERCKFIAYRQLVHFTRAWWLNHIPASAPVNIIPIQLFAAALRWQTAADITPFTDEEMACILANLIRLGHIKGYISWEHMKVVLSKQNPLPKMSTVASSA